MPDFENEFRLYNEGIKDLIIGTDEAGRGPLAGPVVAGAVCFPDFFIEESLKNQLDDSKKLTPLKREKALEALLKSNALIGIGISSVEEIDEINILQASLLAMKRAILQIEEQNVLIGKVLIDGSINAKWNWPSEPLIKGDSKSLSIAAASIVAKVTRDKMMQDLAEQYPFYGWEKNMGYGTKTHLEGLEKHGITPLHRKSFAPIKNYL
ncbi:MAG: ribonuclease HII [Alphaproteobacteria bacterium]|nr:ribonuclease HII [Alphaproteobacteria bacterium]